jgi:diketogulonate reductase-like aldo/keto reductase
MQDAFASLSRRACLRLGAGAAAGLSLAPLAPATAQGSALPRITKPIPSSGEQLPVIGIGTNQYSVEAPEDMARLQQVLAGLPEQGGSVIDTARVYGRAEEVIGELLQEIGGRERYFIVTKTAIGGEIASPEQEVQTAFDRLKLDTIDVLLIHNLHALDQLMPEFIRAKEAGRVRYIGMSTSVDGQYEAQMAAMRRYPLDFIQVDYSIVDRSAGEAIIPLAQERAMAVMANMPFGGARGAASTFSRVAGRDLPDWAADIDATSWAQVFLKYIVSHPGINVAIPGTTRMDHLLDNQAAGRGRLPDAAVRTEIERYWDALA